MLARYLLRPARSLGRWTAPQRREAVPVQYRLSRFYSPTAAEAQTHSKRLGELMVGDNENLEAEGEEGGRRRRGGDGGKRPFDMWKVKQRRFTRHITNLVKKGKVEEAEQVFQDMLSAKVRPDTAVFNNLIAGLSRTGDAQKAFKLFNNLKKRGLVPTDYTYASLFRALSKMGPSCKPLLEKVMLEIDRRDFLPNTIATNSLMVAMTTCGMIDEVFGVYSDMSRRGGRGQSADVSTFTTLLVACSRDGERGMERVSGVWREMVACGIQPDIVAFNTLLQCVREAGIPHDMKQRRNQNVSVPAINSRDLHSIFQSPPPHSSEPSQTNDGKGHGRGRSSQRSPGLSIVSKTQVHLGVFGRTPWTIHVTSSGWRWLDAENTHVFLGVLKESNLKPNLHTLHQLSHLTVDWATVVTETAVVGGANGEGGVVFMPDKRCLNAAVSLQAHLGNIRGAEVLNRFGEEVGLPLGPEGYVSLAAGCRGQGQGMELLEQMRDAGVVPDQRVMGTLLRNAASKLEYEYLTSLMKEMRHCKVEPDDYIVRVLEKVSRSQAPQSPRMKLRFNGFNGYYSLWKKHYPKFYNDI